LSSPSLTLSGWRRNPGRRGGSAMAGQRLQRVQVDCHLREGVCRHGQESNTQE